MGAEPPAAGRAVVDGAAHERMAEAEAARHVRRAHEIEPQQLVERVERVGLVDVGRRGGELGRERVAGDRRALEHAARAPAGEQRELLGQRGGHVARELAGAPERARELLQVERVAAALS